MGSFVAPCAPVPVFASDQLAEGGDGEVPQARDIACTHLRHPMRVVQDRLARCDQIELSTLHPMNEGS